MKRLWAFVPILALAVGLLISPTTGPLNLSWADASLWSWLHNDPAYVTGNLSWLARHQDGTVFIRGQSHNTITTVGKTALRDCMGGTGTPTCTTFSAYKYHGIGTGTAGGAGATGCTTELTTQYNPDNTRATGTQTNNGSNVYRSVATNTVDASVSITEFCLMSQSATGGGSIWATVGFTAVALNGGDSLQTTYDATFN